MLISVALFVSTNKGTFTALYNYSICVSTFMSIILVYNVWGLLFILSHRYCNSVRLRP